MIHYCKANLLDLFSIEHLERTCFLGEAFRQRLIKNLLSSPKSIVMKATLHPDAMVGNIIGIVKKVNGKGVGRVFSLCVLEEHRKKGIATGLIQRLEEDFFTSGVKKITLEVNVRNTAAQRFYQRHGYRTAPAVLPNFYRDGSDALVMSKVCG